MLSYRHGFHAGNFADVHKHCLLLLLLHRLQAKPAPLCYFETHAGRGSYALDDEQALKNREFDGGIGRLQAATGDLPAPVADYLAAVAALRAADPNRYPGSPLLVASRLREQDRAVLMELHASEAPVLRALFRDDRRVAVHHRDGYEGLAALLPPTQKRGLVLIDPSYELKTEYAELPKRLLLAWRRWQQGCYMLWYPLLPAAGHRTLLARLRDSGIRRILDSRIEVRRPAATGMYGSGALVINPPWQLEQDWDACNRWLAARLAVDRAEAASDWLVPE